MAKNVSIGAQYMHRVHLVYICMYIEWNRPDSEGMGIALFNASCRKNNVFYVDIHLYITVIEFSKSYKSLTNSRKTTDPKSIIFKIHTEICL